MGWLFVPRADPLFRFLAMTASSMWLARAVLRSSVDLVGMNLRNMVVLAYLRDHRRRLADRR